MHGAILLLNLPRLLLLSLGISLLASYGEGAMRRGLRTAPIITTADSSKALDGFGEHSKPSLESLKRSVLRISVYRKVWRWSRPFDNHYVVGSLGSGFLVGDRPLTICTCAHVVRGADRVYLQIPDFGKTRFEGQVE